MTALLHPLTRRRIEVPDESANEWLAAGWLLDGGTDPQTPDAAASTEHDHTQDAEAPDTTRKDSK